MPGRIFLSLGSNINPQVNLLSAASELRNNFGHVDFSSVIETVSVGSSGPNFLNAAAVFWTKKPMEELKHGFIRNLERSLGRIRTPDKNSPRTIDLDITVFNQVVVDPNIWIRVYLAVPLAELFPTLIEEKSGQSILEISKELKKRVFWKARPDIDLNSTI